MSLKNLRVSKVIKHHRHDAKTLTLTIELRSGAVYNYDDVSVKEYEDFANAESLGKHFSEHIKKKKYSLVRPAPAEAPHG